jgi:hypothetical protein
MPLQIFHGTDVAVNPIGEPQMAYTSPVKKLLVTETIIQTVEGPVNLTQAVSDAFARTGVEVIKPVQFTIGTQVAGQSTATSLPADHVITVTLDKPVSPLGPSQLILGTKTQTTIAVRSEMMTLLEGGATKTVWLRNYTANVAHGINYDANAIGAQIVNKLAEDWAHHYKPLSR